MATYEEAIELDRDGNLPATASECNSTSGSGITNAVDQVFGFSTDPFQLKLANEEGQMNGVITDNVIVKQSPFGGSNFGDLPTLSFEDDIGSNSISFLLLSIDDLVGDADGQIPQGATIVSATMTVNTVASTWWSTGNGLWIHRALVPWEENTVTFDSFTGDGVLTAGVEYDATELDYYPGSVSGKTSFDLTTSIQSIVDGHSQHGFFIRTGNNAIQLHSTETAMPELAPSLERVMRLELTTYSMASCRSSQLSYTRFAGTFSPEGLAMK